MPINYKKSQLLQTKLQFYGPQNYIKGFCGPPKCFPLLYGPRTSKVWGTLLYIELTYFFKSLLTYYTILRVWEFFCKCFVFVFKPVSEENINFFYLCRRMKTY
jgi:hypothetical protein